MKVFSYVIVAIIAFVAAFFCTTVFDNDGFKVDFVEPSPEETQYEESTSYQTYYNQLTDYQKSIYNALLEPISRCETKINIENVEDLSTFRNNCFKVTQAIQYDHPEYFWFTGGYRYTERYSTFNYSGSIVFEPYYYEYADYSFNSSEKMNLLMNKVKTVAELTRNTTSQPYEQITFVHDYIIANAYYDHDALDEFYQTSHNPTCEYIFSAYGCLVEGKTVCSGYAKSFQLIMNELGFDCTYVTGDAGEAHGWNCIYIDGEGYFIDVTWDDPDYDTGIPFYNYMCIDSTELSRTHTLDTEYFEEVVCTDETYDYFNYYGYYTEAYDFDKVCEIFAKQSERKTLYIKFGSPNELGKAYEELTQKGKIYSVPALDSNAKWSYIYNRDHCTLTFMSN